ncbi:hypothetical protein sphantq_02215 [Sphingobium sp. AntQ-1]|nr:hypothetical protein sphantq_02215 [Sphingobium sp. AntQ-1]
MDPMLRYEPSTNSVSTQQERILCNLKSPRSKPYSAACAVIAVSRFLPVTQAKKRGTGALRSIQSL